MGDIAEPAGMDVSRDGQHVAYITNGTFTVARVPGGETEQRWNLRHSSAGAIAFGPDNLVLLSFDRLRAWRVPGLWPIGTGFTRHGGESIAMSPDGQTLVSAGTSVIDLWDTKAWTVRDSLIGIPSYVNTVLFSPNGRQIASGGGSKERGKGLIILWDLSTHRQIWRHETAGYSGALAFSADGRWLVIAGGEGKAVILDSRSGKVATEWVAHREGVYAVAFSPDGRRVVASGFQSSMRFWDFDSLAAKIRS